MRAALLVLALLAGCEPGKFIVNIKLISNNGGKGIANVSNYGAYRECLTGEPPCFLDSEFLPFTLAARPGANSRFDGWKCGTIARGENPLTIDQVSYDAMKDSSSEVRCTATFTNDLAERCAAAKLRAEMIQQHIQTADPYTLGPLVLPSGSLNDPGFVLAERCDADERVVTAHSAAAVQAKAPEPATNTVMSATRVVEHPEAVQHDCNAPEHIAGACGPAAKFYVYAWVFAESPLELFNRSALAPNDQFQFSAVFDTDGSPSNNYVPSSQYPNDFWLGTDTQFAATYANGSWSLRKTVGPSLTAMPTDAVLFARDGTMMWAIPASEVGIVDSVIPSGFGVRTSLFRHGGDYGINPPYNWSGDVDPPVDQPLYSLP